LLLVLAQDTNVWPSLLILRNAINFSIELVNVLTSLLAVQFLLVNKFLLLNPLTILNELVVEFVIDEPVHQACADDVVSLGDLVAHAP